MREAPASGVRYEQQIEVEEAVMEALEQSIGRKLKELRLARGATLADVTEMTGLTKGYLSKIENGRQMPPIETLAKISAGLNADIAYFFQKDDSDDEQNDLISIVKAHERKRVVRGASAFGYNYEALAYKKSNKSFEPFIFTFPSDEDESETPSFTHEGEEMLYILEGTVRLILDGVEHILTAGDCAYIDSTVPHRGSAVNGTARALVVIYRDKSDESDDH